MSDSTNLISVDRNILNYKGITTTTTGAKTAAEALEAAELNWNVEVRQAGFQVKGGVYKTAGPLHKAIVRPDTNECFAFVGSKYHPIQNHEMFDWADALVDGAGANYEAAWSFNGGRDVGLTMRFTDDVMIGGEDPYGRYLLLRGRHDGKGSVTAAVTSVRMHCTNMLDIAIRGAGSRVVRIAHLANATQKLAAARETLEVTFKYMDDFNKSMEALIRKTISDELATELVAETFAKTRFGGIEEKTARVIDLSHNSATLAEEYGSTAYGVLQGFTEWLDWERESKSAQSAIRDTLEGRVHVAKQHLYDCLVAA